MVCKNYKLHCCPGYQGPNCDEGEIKHVPLSYRQVDQGELKTNKKQIYT